VPGPASVRVCRYCDTANWTNAEFCRRCFRPLTDSPVERVVSPSPSTARPLENRFVRWSLVLGLVGVAVLALGAVFVPATPSFVFALGGLFLFFGAVGFLAGWQAQRYRGLARDPDRPPP
jgi:hypothetical protein